LALAPDGWFSVEGYLSHKTGELDSRLSDVRHVLIIREGKVPGKKAIAMRFVRYYRQGLLKRRRVGHKFLYKMTDKGILRSVALKNR
jgi:hypothetical protein